MGKPKFMILGVQRGGTTSLAVCFQSHPQVTMPICKEDYCIYPNSPIKFVIDNKQMYLAAKQCAVCLLKNGINKEPSYFNRLYDWISLEKYYELFPDDLIGFDASPDYFDCSKAPARIAKVLPDLKFIVMLRNPIVRAWSHYWHEVNVNKTESKKFKEAVRRPLNNDDDWFFFSYLQRGWYAQHLKRWFTHFPRENFKIVISEDFFKEPEIVFTKLQEWLGLDPILSLQEYPHMNKLDKPDMPEDIKIMLAEYYYPYQKKLEQLLNGNQTENKS